MEPCVAISIRSRVRVLVDTVLKERSPPFDLLYSSTGRPSIIPEPLRRVLLLLLLYTVRRERLWREQLDYNLLSQWVAGLHRDDPIWDTSTLRKNHARWWVPPSSSAWRFSAVC
jgi:transposase